MAAVGAGSTSNAQTVYDDLLGLGLSSGAATGVVGNLVAESSVNPGAIQPNGQGHGIAQWSQPGRWDTLVAWANSKGLNPWALTTQEGFMVNEMKSDGVWSALQSISDAGTAAALVMRKYEMPQDQSDQNAAYRAQLGTNAVLDTTSGQSLSSGLSGLISATGDIPGNLASAATGALTGAASSTASTILSGIQPIIIKGLFVALGVGLVGAGLYKAVSPKVPSASSLAPLAAAL